MNHLRGRFGRRWMGLAFVWLGLAAGCSGGAEAPGPQVGALEMSLVALGPSGTVYRLREARFRVRGGGAYNDAGAIAYNDVWSSEDAPGDFNLRRQVPDGDYEISLRRDWRMERLSPYGDVDAVDATLLSARTQSAYVAPGATTFVVYEFEVDGQRVILDGRLGIGIRVYERDADAGTDDDDGGVDHCDDDSDAGATPCPPLWDYLHAFQR